MEHGERTGGFYSCNRYEAAKKEGEVSNLVLHLACTGLTFSLSALDNFRVKKIFLIQYDEAENRRERAKISLERYTHYYERWATNQSVCIANCRQLMHLDVTKWWKFFMFPIMEKKKILACFFHLYLFIYPSDTLLRVDLPNIIILHFCLVCYLLALDSHLSCSFFFILLW